MRLTVLSAFLCALSAGTALAKDPTPTPTAAEEKTSITARMADGKIQGFAIDGLTPKHPLHTMGLRNGDVLLAINGKRLTSMSEMIVELQKKRPKVEYTVLRDGKESKIEFGEPPGGN